MQASFFLCSSDYINHGSIFFFVSLDLLYFNRLNFSFQQISLINSTIQMFFFFHFPKAYCNTKLSNFSNMLTLIVRKRLVLKQAKVNKLKSKKNVPKSEK